VAASEIPNAGNGLFATVAFEPNEWITEYGGEVIDKAEADRRLSAGVGTHLRTLKFGSAYLDGRLVKPVAGAGGASFANDPYRQRSKRVNAKFRVVTVFQEKGFVCRSGGFVVPERVMLQAVQRIRCGEEIYVDYGERLLGVASAQLHLI
jgi:hypothetical protein